MTATYSKYHGIGNEVLVKILADGNDVDARQEMKDRGNDDGEIDRIVQEEKDRRSERLA